MNNILSEKEYQHFIMERLEQDNGYVIRKATSYDRLFAMDREMLFQFLNDTQPEAMEALRKIYKADLEDTIVSFINAEATKARGSLLALLKHGMEISNMKLELMYTKPATNFNRDLLAKYEKNIFSVMEEVWASDDERIDLVIFLNGLVIMSFELKCNAAGLSYQDAIYQYRVDRNPKTRLFWFKAGCLVNFAMDLEEVYMTTKLAGNATFFLPFNMGNGEGVNAGAGNPTYEDHYSVSYMWEDILTKDTVLDLVSKFIFIESKESEDELTGKKKTSENVIFPRYHQLDVIRRVLADVRENRTSQNYLIQHSAGSGKTNSIAWLAHRLTSLHDADNKIIFDNVIIVTDRVVVDRQLQKAIMGMEHKAGLIRVMDDKCNSADLAMALNGNTKIIATTIQKFPYMTENAYESLVGVLRNKKNIILQGAPGVGKTFAARRLAWSMMGEMDDSRIEFVQFHQNYSYEDFVMGYKPAEDGFELKYGIFYRFCQKAANQPDKEFFFIIDEINRGNMSKILGELLMLIEKDYRGSKATLAYNGLAFSVPKNLYIIGMMNTADRSLAMIDYALRRRFSFYDMEPGFDSDGFIQYKNGLNNETLNELVERVKELNKEIAMDKSLGKGFCIGHSYFCGRDVCTDEWLHAIVNYDILPMLSEYWFDDAGKLQRWENILRGVFQ